MKKKTFFFHWLVVVTSNIDPYVIEWLIAHRVPNPLISFWHHFIPNTSTNPYMYHTCITYQTPKNDKLSNPIWVSFYVQYMNILVKQKQKRCLNFTKFTSYIVLRTYKRGRTPFFGIRDLGYFRSGFRDLPLNFRDRDLTFLQNGQVKIQVFCWSK